MLCCVACGLSEYEPESRSLLYVQLWFHCAWILSFVSFDSEMILPKLPLSNVEVIRGPYITSTKGQWPIHQPRKGRNRKLRAAGTATNHRLGITISTTVDHNGLRVFHSSVSCWSHRSEAPLSYPYYPAHARHGGVSRALCACYSPRLLNKTDGVSKSPLVNTLKDRRASMASAVPSFKRNGRANGQIL